MRTLHNIDVRHVRLSEGRECWVAKCTCGWIRQGGKWEVSADAAVHYLMPDWEAK